jgi:hypothetical protein
VKKLRAFHGNCSWKQKNSSRGGIFFFTVNNIYSEKKGIKTLGRIKDQFIPENGTGGGSSFNRSL